MHPSLGKKTQRLQHSHSSCITVLLTHEPLNATSFCLWLNPTIWDAFSVWTHNNTGKKKSSACTFLLRATAAGLGGDVRGAVAPDGLESAVMNQRGSVFTKQMESDRFCDWRWVEAELKSETGGSHKQAKVNLGNIWSQMLCHPHAAN